MMLIIASTQVRTTLPPQDCHCIVKSLDGMSRSPFKLGACSMCLCKQFQSAEGLKLVSWIAGCFAGGALAYSAGPKGMCIGCASFAAFSYMIDRFMER